MFARRTDWDLIPNNLARVREALESSGVDIVDLTTSNPTACALAYPQDAIREALSDPAVLVYRPEPRGLPSARDAVAAYYADHGVAVSPEHVVLTASTSEAYHYLFLLLLERGQRALVPRPSYPLFDFLAGLADTELVPYGLRGATSPDQIDVAALEARMTDRDRAVLVVHPNNPTGATLSVADRDALVHLCAAGGRALLADEVFLDYAGDADGRCGTLVGTRETLTFVMSGLSKVAGLPQLKMGWIVVSGPEALRTQALSRLEVIADTYLSVNTPVQVAAPRLLADRGVVQTAIAERLAANRAFLGQALTDPEAAEVISAPAGWYAVIRLPRVPDEEELVLQLLQDEHVLVHPGYFYDLPEGAHAVVSLLVQPERFAAGIGRLLALAAQSPIGR